MKKINWGNWGIRAGALVLAFFLWLYAVTEHLYDKEIDIRLQVEDPSSPSPQDREVIVAGLPPRQVRVMVSGKGKDLLHLESDGFLMRLRPEGRAGSVRTYRLTPDLVENRSTELAVKIEEVVAPKEVEIALDWRVEREVPVKSAIELVIADRYIQVGETSIEPRVVALSGPAGLLGRVTYVSTDSLVLNQVQEDVDLLLTLRPPAGMRCALNPAQVQVRADVQPLAQDDLEQVPVKVRHSMGRRVELEPSRVRVKVKGGFDILANLDSERDLELFVDFRDFTGEPLSVLYEDSPRFDIIEIVPSKVDLVER